MSSIKPCPFCGRVPTENTIVTDKEAGIGGYGKWGFVQCCINGPEVRTEHKPLAHWKQRAIDAWNTRVPEISIEEQSK